MARAYNAGGGGDNIALWKRGPFPYSLMERYFFSLLYPEEETMSSPLQKKRLIEVDEELRKLHTIPSTEHDIGFGQWRVKPDSSACFVCAY